MKVCQLCAVDFTLLHFLLPLMEATRAAGHDVVGVCSEGAFAERVRDKGFRVEHVGFRRNYDLVHHVRTYRELVRLFRRECFDIVHVHSPISALIARPAAVRAGVPKVVYTAHGFYFHEHQPWLMRRFFMFLEWMAGRFTDVLFTQSREDADTARRANLCRGGVIEAIGNGVDSARFHPPQDPDERARVRRELGANDDDIVILVVGRLVAEKGYPELFDAIAGLAGIRLWVVGERLESDYASPITDALARIGGDTGLRDRVRLLGYRDDVDRLMRAADVFTLPSHREGMPRSIIEAMMSGLPVVATNIRGSREEVVDGETGFLVPVRDSGALGAALRRLAEDANLRRRLGTAGRERAIELFEESRVIERQLQRLGLLKEMA